MVKTQPFGLQALGCGTELHTLWFSRIEAGGPWQKSRIVIVMAVTDVRYTTWEMVGLRAVRGHRRLCLMYN